MRPFVFVPLFHVSYQDALHHMRRLAERERAYLPRRREHRALAERVLAELDAEIARLERFLSATPRPRSVEPETPTPTA